MRKTMLVVLIAVVGAACSSSPTDDPLAPTLVAVPEGLACSDVIIVPESSDRTHTDIGEVIEYATDPPTSGRHYGTWADTGIHTDEIPDGFQVHNLEHGHVFIQYRDLTDEQSAELEERVRDDSFMTHLAPRSEMPWVLALTSWGRIQVCGEYPEDAIGVIDSFVDANRDNAPESIP